ncbi:uncharacterized protein LOC101450710 [Ceratitis capitata]|uniref:uncharacterized protein LOC101450710 n=1 Tax=Ceratitis capitata TaxID=7213 RepID=UPI000329AC1D|nr:uncharacterized protein LOC101450710 [Ceratitis capitata]XP_020713851.1 uncharacterized protein LOC101450710 [Ceratitis capitata]
MTAKPPKSANKGVKRRNERNILTFYEKIAVIHCYDETSVSRNRLAKLFHCCATQIRRILEHKDELLQQLATLSESDASNFIEEMARKRRKFEMTAISFILHEWVERCRVLRLRKSITNQTLKATALKMATLLNLPSFRPSYRWLDRFRGKYKYTAEDLGTSGPDAVDGELAVEDIIIEFKDALPNFMQTEISAITSLDKVTDGVDLEKTKIPRQSASNENSIDYAFSDDDGEVEEVREEIENDAEALVLCDSKHSSGCSSNTDTSTLGITNSTTPEDNSGQIKMNAGTTAVLGSIFPHLAVIHQFALLNADVKALELISQLGVHMQNQAVEGAYKQLTLASTSDEPIVDSTQSDVGALYAADLDDIVLIE